MPASSGSASGTGAREDAEFRLRLVRDPEFARSAPDIVIEFANPLHQDLLDRFVDGDAPLPDGASAIWRDTTQPGAWDSPVYEEFLRAVRQLNGGLPRERRIRVLAGDWPIDWSLTSHETLQRDGDRRDRFAASVIERAVLNRGHKALVVFGALHLYRKRPGNIVDILQGNPQARWFVIVPLGGPGLPEAIRAELVGCAKPAWMALAGAAAGGMDANDLFEQGAMRVKIVDGKPLLADGKPVLEPVQVFAPGTPARQAADACLYFGDAPPDFAPPPDAIYAGTPYGREVRRRRAVIFGSPR